MVLHLQRQAHTISVGKDNSQQKKWETKQISPVPNIHDSCLNMKIRCA